MRLDLSLSLGSASLNQGGGVVVTDSAELASALAAATGGETIRVSSAGSPYTVSASSLSPASGVTVTALTPNDPPEFDELTLTSCDNFSFTNLSFIPSGAGTGQVTIAGGSDCAIGYCTFDGGATEHYTGTQTLGKRGIDVSGHTNLHLHHNTLSGNSFAIKVDGTNVNTLIEYNDITLNQYDGVIITADHAGLTVQRNRMDGSLGASWAQNHSDGIQLSTTDATADLTDIVLKDNIIISTPNGSMRETIFISPDNPSFGFKGVEITGNVLGGSTYFGIRVNGLIAPDTGSNIVSENVVIHDSATLNIADGASGTDEVPAIYVVSATNTGTLIERNISEKYVNVPANGATSDGITANDNYTAARTPYGDSAMVRLVGNADPDALTADQIEALTFPTGYGPSYLQDAGYEFPAAVADPNPEQVVDPFFADATKHTISGGGQGTSAVSGGRLNLNTSSQVWYYLPDTIVGPLPAGDYTVTYEIESFTSGSGISLVAAATTNLLSGPFFNGAIRTAPGVYSETVTIPSGSGYIGKRGRGSTPTVAVDKSFSIKPV